MEFMPKINGKFGSSNTKQWPVTFGMNSKGGMDDDEYKKFILGSIIPLFPDFKDIPGKRVMIKVDSGPGRLQHDLLVMLQLIDVYKYPGVPNTTAMTHKTNQNNGPFKPTF